MAVDRQTIQTAGYRKLTSHGSTGEECTICGKQTAGLDGALHVAIDHTTSEFVTDAEAATRGDNCSLYPIGPECAKRYRKAMAGNVTISRLRRHDAIIQPC